ncbi:MAG: Flp pilus assembly complex ATPase component TadA [Clostridia bacterium]|nr:Flp pilus assembly complex ATPase component TadA [Clostridia bacterium]
MIELGKIIDEALERGASDIHIICGLKPVLRIQKSLLPSKYPVLTEEDIYGIYDQIVDGKVEMDEIYKNTRIIDTAIVHKGIRLRVNVSSFNEIPLFTLRIIKDELPAFEDLGLPEVVRQMMYQPQGVILVTGKTNSGKTTTLSALINYVNETQNKKILTLEAPVEYKHKSKKSIIVQKEVGVGGDSLTYFDGVKNSLREDCDILVIGEIRDKDTMNAAIDMAEAGHLVIGTLHTKSCAETLDRIINFYEFSDQAQIKYLMATLLKIIVSQRLIPNAAGNGLVMVPEVMVVDDIVAGFIRKEKFSISGIEDAISSSVDKGSRSLITSLAESVIKGDLTIEQAEGQVEAKNADVLRRTVRQLGGNI